MAGRRGILHAMDLKRFSASELDHHERDLAAAVVAVREEKIRRNLPPQSGVSKFESWWVSAKRDLFQVEVLPNRSSYAEADAIYAFIVSAEGNDCEQIGPQELADVEFNWLARMAELEDELGLPSSYGATHGESDCDSQSDTDLSASDSGGGSSSSDGGGACSSSSDKRAWSSQRPSQRRRRRGRSSSGGGSSSGGNTGSGGGPSAVGF